MAPAGVPTQINHQGVVSVNGQRFNGNGKFYFAIIDPSSGNSVWTNDGTNVGTLNRPNQPVTVACVNGLYSVALGDAALANMTPVTLDVFSDANRSLRIWFDDGTNGIHQMLPDHPLTSVPYAHRIADNGSAPGARFGGTGADGALNLVSETVNIDLGGASSFIRNYTSISITGIGKLTFSNPHPDGTVVVLKSQGDVTLTSAQVPMVDCSSLGADGGVSDLSGSYDGANGQAIFGITSGGHFGVGAASCSGGACPGDGGAATQPISLSVNHLTGKFIPFAVGGGGGGGGSGQNGQEVGGNGGRGGGALIIECGRALNFTKANGISVAGASGSPGHPLSGGPFAGGGGGGGGAGGSCVIIYNALVANTGTINVSGGSGGLGGIGDPDCGAGGGGGGGGASFSGGDAGIRGGTCNMRGGNGGAGGNGASLVVKNTEFP